MTVLRSIFGIVVAIGIAPAMAFAQETPATFEFSFSNPGARSLGLGGAFAAFADDATAAFANPAGLVQLVRPEVSAELRHWRYTTPYIEGGRYEGEPTGIGLDTTRGLRASESREQLTGLSFLSFVYPKGNLSLAVYLHQLAKFKAETETQGLFHSSGTGSETSRTYDRRWSTDLDVVSYGLAGAYRLGDHLSVGLSLVYFEGRMEAPFEWTFFDDSSLESFFGPNSYLPERQLVTGDMAIDDSDWGLNAGLLWNMNERWSIGAFYRQGPEFGVVYGAVAGPMAPLFDPALTEGATVLTVATPMKFPDVYGLGLAYRSRDGKLAVGFEWDRVEYSSIFGSFNPVVIESADDDLDLDVQLAADDGDELHLGAEYALLELKPVLAVRAGIWFDPDHRFHSISTDPEHQALFQPGDDEIHFAFGVGLAFTSFQIDLAADFSDLVDTFSLSVICSF